MGERVVSQAGSSAVRMAVLAQVVCADGAATGYAIGQAMQDRYDGVLAGGRQRAYDELPKLRRAGLVELIRRASRDTYRATPAGVAAWRAWLASDIDVLVDGRRAAGGALAEARRELRVRLCSARPGDLRALVAVVSRYEAALLRAQARAQAPAAVEEPLRGILADHADLLVTAELRWCQEARERLEAAIADG